MEPKSTSVKLNNEGEVYTPNRAARRRKPVVDRDYTKSTHKDKKRKMKNAKKFEYAKRAANRARKASQENTAKLD